MNPHTPLARRILRNDLRLFWRGNAAKKTAWATSMLGRIGIVAMLHLMAFGLFSNYVGSDRVAGGPQLTCLVLLLLMTMTALHSSLEVLYNRGDLSLLLASPVPARVVLLTRLIGITLTSLFATLALVLPILDVGIALFGWRWAWGFPTWICIGLLITPAAVLTTLAAVERFGVRRARTFMQAFGILVGMLGVAASQLPNWVITAGSRSERQASRQALMTDLFAWFDVPPLRQLAAAATGSWQWLLPLAIGSIGLFALAHRALAVRFTHGAQGATGDVGGGARVAAGPAWRAAFARPRWQVLWRTQLLLLRRDPLLLMRCAMQIVSLVPMLFGAMMLNRAAGIGGVAVMAASVVPIQLAAMLNAGDEAHEFVATSPMQPRERALARSLAAAAPLLVFAWIMAAVLTVIASPLAAAMVAIGGTVNAASSAWLGTCTTRAHTAEERSRNRPARVGWQMFLGMFLAGCGIAGIGVTDAGQPLIGVAVFAGAMLLTSLLFLVSPRRATYAS